MALVLAMATMCALAASQTFARISGLPDLWSCR